MSKRTLLAFFACGLLVIFLQPKSLVAATPTLAGSWQLTFNPSAPPTPPAVPIPGLVTFTSDGSTIETDGSQLAPGVASTTTGAVTYSSSGHGVWALLPAMTGFYISYDSISVNADGSLHSTTVTVASVTVTTGTNGTTLSGTYTTTTTTSSGEPPKTITGKLTGTLIPRPALP